MKCEYYVIHTVNFRTVNLSTTLLVDILNSKMCLRRATVFYSQQCNKINKTYKINTNKIK